MRRRGMHDGKRVRARRTLHVLTLEDRDLRARRRLQHRRVLERLARSGRRGSLRHQRRGGKGQSHRNGSGDNPKTNHGTKAVHLSHAHKSSPSILSQSRAASFAAHAAHAAHIAPRPSQARTMNMPGQPRGTETCNEHRRKDQRRHHRRHEGPRGAPPHHPAHGQVRPALQRDRQAPAAHRRRADPDSVHSPASSAASRSRASPRAIAPSSPPRSRPRST